MELLVQQARSLLANETDFIANAANLAALIFHSWENINWAGFYFLKQNELVLGPFQGKPACVRIPFGKGVCGSCAQQRQTLNVIDVHQFPGHIACDPVSNSEIVVPLIKHQKILGVLDIDSPQYSRFDNQDQQILEAIAELYLQSSYFFKLTPYRN